ncbi:MAG: sigma-54-dependent Fis family transcriptional regulator [Deltaproteobacteria bacterium]|nr:sigma-54-dependent Fis family transcriptional regulator [Deltaproteobacteria bacterium]TLN02573.1 MAG: sigma-54-dependent Fis family transcriptional regulator [bacterium]
MERILVVEDDATFRGLLKTILAGEGYEVVDVPTAEKALAHLRSQEFDLVVSDLRMPGKSGMDLFRETRNFFVPPPFILLTAYGTIEEAVDAMKEGAADFLTKPLKDPDVLRALAKKILNNGRRERDYLSLKELENAGLPPERLIFAGKSMEEIRRLVREVAGTGTTVIIYGESGTGKELIARMLHLLSPRRAASFIPVNCASIPDSLLESELFGHEKGAFTGAVQARRGKFELAQGGTLFLDEIGEMPLALQAKLLRVLQERTFERVGGSREIRSDVRVLAATNRNLEKDVRDGLFREDLYYRLQVFPVQLPPLRERQDAIVVLAEHFVGHFARLTGKRLPGITPEALTSLQSYHWPGNIRELQNVIERAVILARADISLADLPVALTVRTLAGKEQGGLKELEREAILAALQRTGGNRRMAAEELGLSRRTLQYRLKEYGLIEDD